MKIVMISGNPIGEFYGGVKVHVEYLSSFLSNFEDLKLILLTFGTKNFKYEKNGINYVVLKRLKFGKILFPIQIFYDLFRLEREVKKLNPDLIHIQSTIPTFSLFAAYITRRYPLLITVHGYIKEECKFHTGLEKIINVFLSSPLERWALSKIPNIITVCPQIKEIIQKITYSNIFIIPNGIDVKYIQAIKPFKTYTNHTIFYIGVLNKRKGVDDLVRAIPLVKYEIKDIRLYVAGTGPDMNKLKNLVKNLNLEKNVIFLGFISEENKFSYMKSMDVFVLATYWESFPIVLLEAMACGKPIITTDVAGNPFAVIDGINGFLVKPGNWRQISEKLIYLFKNEELIKKMGEESKKRALCFDWITIAQQTRDIYLKIDGATKVEMNNKI
jgi:glycosyltransferase involved in cell wall biosynthesis